MLNPAIDRLPVPQRVREAAEVAMHDGLDAVLDTVTPMVAAQMLRVMASAFMDPSSGLEDNLNKNFHALMQSGVSPTIGAYNQLLATTYLVMADGIDPDESEAVDRGKKEEDPND